MGDQKSAGNAAFTQLGTDLATGLRDTYKGGLDVFGKDLNAGLGGKTTTALNQLWTQSGQPNNIDEATRFGNSLLTGNGLTGGQTSASSGLKGLIGQYGNLVGANGLTNVQNNAVNSLNTLGRQYGGLTGSTGSLADERYHTLNMTYDGMADKLAGQSEAEKALTGIAGKSLNPALSESVLMDSALGKQVGEQNPYLMKMLEDNAARTAADMGAAFGSAGRFGGSGHAQDLGDTLSRTRNEVMYKDLQDSMARQRQDLSAIEGLRKTGRDEEYRAITGADSARLNQLGARTGLLDRQASMVGAEEAARRGQLADRIGLMDRQAGLQGTIFNQGQQAVTNKATELAGQSGLYNTLFNQGQQGIANQFAAAGQAGGLADAALDGARTRLGVGQVLDADSQAELLAQRDLFDRTKNADFNNIARILGLATGGLGQMDGVKEKTPWWQTLLGAGTAAAGAFL